MLLAYIQLAAAIGLEFIGTNALKLSAGFTKIPYAALASVTFVACFFLFARSLEQLNLSIAYAIWCGVGIVLTATASVIFYHEQLSSAGISGITLILIGVIITSATTTH